MGDVPLQIFIIVLLIALNAFFASAEIAVLSVNDTKIRHLAESGNKQAKVLVRFIENSGEFLSTIQVGVTFSGFLSSAVAADSFSSLLANFITKNNTIYTNYYSAINSIAVVVITLTLSFFTLVFGELVPKRIAMKKSEKLALSAAKPLRFTAVVFNPFIKLLTFSVNCILKLMHINTDQNNSNVSEEEILLLVNEGQEKGIIGDEEGEMINNVFTLNDKTAEDVMTHRTEIVAVNITDDLKAIMDIAINEQYSRIPVYEDSIDNIVGIIHIKDLLRVKDNDCFEVKSVMRYPLFVPESQKIDEVFKDLKLSKNHLAVVVDEYGGTAGIVTMEDIFEELVGNISDEYDREEDEESSKITKLDDCTYLVDGLAELDDLADIVDADLPLSDFDTISGFAISVLGEIPDEEVNPEFEYGGYSFKIISHTDKRITSLKIAKLPPKNEEDGD